MAFQRADIAPQSYAPSIHGISQVTVGGAGCEQSLASNLTSSIGEHMKTLTPEAVRHYRKTGTLVFSANGKVHVAKDLQERALDDHPGYLVDGQHHVTWNLLECSCGHVDCVLEALARALNEVRRAPKHC